VSEGSELYEHRDPNQSAGGKGGAQAKQKEYTPIGKYKPTGNLVYTPELFEKIEKKVTFM
jgi:hypothetical protein